jgi:hypothetical protein
MARWKCVLCGEPGERTREHAVPSWVAARAPGEGPFVTTRTAGGRWVSEELTVTVGEVCRKCNEGWLSRLEERVKAIACPAIVGRRCVWSPKEQRTLALWAFKTAFMMTLATGTSSVPPADYRFLFRNLRPRGRARVWAAAHAPPSGPAVSLSLAHIQPVELTLHNRWDELPRIRTHVQCRVSGAPGPRL